MSSVPSHDRFFFQEAKRDADLLIGPLIPRPCFLYSRNIPLLDSLTIVFRLMTPTTIPLLNNGATHHPLVRCGSASPALPCAQ